MKSKHDGKLPRQSSERKSVDSKVILAKDYKTLKATDGEGNVADIDMPETSNVLQYFTEDGTKISVRPSGTEPKIKFYMEVKGEMGCPKCYDAANAAAEEKVEAVRSHWEFNPVTAILRQKIKKGASKVKPFRTFGAPFILCLCRHGLTRTYV